ncbi:MAG TPA: hypothetical protein PKG95_03220 [Anaerolineaceae bacterium]|nr:hypothetical protein [Anaerolineaceae bacterium]
MTPFRHSGRDGVLPRRIDAAPGPIPTCRDPLISGGFRLLACQQQAGQQ